MVFQPEGTNAMNESTTEHLEQAGTNGASPDASADGPNADRAASPTEEQVKDALKHVVDPELGINIIDLGLVYEVDVSDQGVVHIEYTLTTMGCPIGPLIEQQMQSFLEKVPGVSSVEAEMVLRPPWTPEMMSEEAKAALGYF
jgi:metal-sulfur cluster biosynthetic enzyme